MTRNTTNGLRDAYRFGSRVSELVEPLDFNQYHATELPRIGVERYMIAIEDALRPALHHDPNLVARIPDARNAIDLRNFLTHAYMHIDDLVVWNATQENLPRLLKDIQDVIYEREQTMTGDNE